MSANIYNAQIFSSAILRQQELHETLLKSDCNSSYLIYWQLKIIQWECNGKQSQTQSEERVAKMEMGWLRWGTRVAKMGYPGGKEGVPGWQRWGTRVAKMGYPGG